MNDAIEKTVIESVNANGEAIETITEGNVVTHLSAYDTFWKNVKSKIMENGGNTKTFEEIKELSPYNIKDIPLEKQPYYFLQNVFSQGQIIHIANDAYGTTLKTREEWNEILSDTEAFNNHTLFCPNAFETTDGGRNDNNIGHYRYVIGEIDKGLTLEQQIAFWLGSELPIKSMVYSGNKSVHALIQIFCKSSEEWKENVYGKLFNLLEALGADKKCRNASHLSRFPAGVRQDTGKEQEWLYCNPHAACLTTEKLITKLESLIISLNGKIPQKPVEVIETKRHININNENDSGEYDKDTAYRMAVSWVDKYAPESIQGNGGDMALYGVCCRLVEGYGLERETALKVIEIYNQKKCKPEWNDKDILHKIDCAIEATDQSKKGYLVTRLKSPVIAAKNGKPFSMNDSGNAARFAYYYNDKVCYDYTVKAWRVWDGRKWDIDKENKVMTYAKQMSYKIVEESRVMPESELKTKLLQYAGKIGSRSTLENMIELAKSEKGIAKSSEKFDTNPFLYNVWNGTIDVKTGLLQKHDPMNYITQVSPVDFISGFKSDKLESYLNFSTGNDKDLYHYLQLATGYTLADENYKQVYFFFYGGEDTGKTTYQTALRTIGGDYSATINFETLCEDKNEKSSAPKPEIAGLKGKRIVTSSEIKQGQKIEGGLLKKITGGGEPIKTRFLFGNPFEFKPGFKIWLAANHSPRQDDSDGAIWKRTRRIPFNHRIKEEDKDTSIVKDFNNPKSDLSKAFLAWAVAGAVEYYKTEKLVEPQCIKDSTAEYRKECDPLRDFFEDYLIFNDKESISNYELKTAYTAYCDKFEILPRYRISDKNLTAKMEAKGCTKYRNASGRGLFGAKLKEKDDTTQAIFPSLEPSTTTQLPAPTQPPTKMALNEDGGDTGAVMGDLWG